MNRIAFSAMGTEVEAWVESDGRPLVEWFDEVEAKCSRFIPESELSVLNDSAPGTFQVSGLMAEVLADAWEMRCLTSGLVDIGVGAAVTGWGYDRTFSAVTDLGSRPVAREETSWGFEDNTVKLARGTRLDLGGVAKGWACDRAVDRGLARVVSAGGDMRSNDPETMATVLDPRGGPGARVALGRGALATSSVARRRWRVAGREVSHLIDPRTMEPSRSPVVSATAVAATAVAAEAAAKAVLLHGVDSLLWADRQNWVDAAIVFWGDGSVYATQGLELVA